MASNPENEPTASREVEKPPIEPIRLPTVEEMRGQDIWNNCAVRSVVSGVMGMAKVLSFGLIFGFSHMGFDSFFVFVCLVAEKMWESFCLFFCWVYFFPLSLFGSRENVGKILSFCLSVLSNYIFVGFRMCRRVGISKDVIDLVARTNLLLLGFECIQKGLNFIILK